MIAYQKLINLIIEYLHKDRNVDESDEFCTSYMDMYFELSDELITEVTQKQFEAFDEINLVCDSYERNSKIREADQFCIGEKQLKDKVLFYLNIIRA